LKKKKTRPDHAIKSSVAITKLPLGRDIQKKNMKRRNAILWKYFFSGFLFSCLA